MYTKLLAPAAAALLMGVMVTPTLAQSNNPSVEPPTRQFNEQNVTSDRPFGDMDIDMAMDRDDMMNWRRGFTDEQRAELNGRCSVIGANQAGYGADAAAFCGTFNNTGVPQPTPDVPAPQAVH